MGVHYFPATRRPAKPAAPALPARQPIRELTRIRDQAQGMNPPDEDREACGWPEHMRDQRDIHRLRPVCEDEEDGDGY